MDKKSYYAVIPGEVRYSDLSANAKLLYGEISALCNEKGFCWASNQYFAELYGVHKDTISKWIGQLKSMGFISYQVVERNKRSIYLTHAQKSGGDRRKELGGIDENVKGDRRKERHNITVNNTTNNTVKEGKPSRSLTPGEYSRKFFDEGNHYYAQRDGKTIEDIEMEIFTDVAKRTIDKYPDLNRKELAKEIRKFVEYWLEPTKSGKKVRWELERTFDVNRRISTWINRKYE